MVRELLRLDERLMSTGIMAMDVREVTPMYLPAFAKYLRGMDEQAFS